MTNLYVFSVEFNTYDMDKVHEFSVGIGKDGSKNSLGVAPFGSPGAIPSGPEISYFDNSLHVMDLHRERMLKLDENFEFNKSYDPYFYDEVVHDINDNLFGFNRFNGVTIIEGNEYLFQVIFHYFQTINEAKSAYYQNNTLFIHDKNNKLWSITDPSMDWKDNRKKLRNEENTIELINSGQFEGLSIDSEKRLFLDGKLQTLDYKTFIDYWKTKNDEVAGKVQDGVFTYDRLRPMMMNDYLGLDGDGNHYFSSVRSILVFDKNGLLLDRIRFDSKKSSTYPAVTSEGDIYFMHHGVDKVTLYKIERQW